MKGVLSHVVLLGFLMIVEIETALAKDSQQELYDSPQVQSYFNDLFHESDFGQNPKECAAWIIPENDDYVFIKWPKMQKNYKQIWDLPIPSGALAIAHTHPITVSGRPSLQDISTAKRIKLTIYTISRGGIWKVTPNGSIIRICGQIWYKQMAVRFPGNAAQTSR